MVTDNDGPGIFHEIGYQVTIRNNTVKNNGSLVDPGWLWDAGIQISTSSDAEIYGNTIEVDSSKYAHGIAYLQQNRGSGPYGAHRTANNNAHDNIITVDGPNARGAAGVVQDFSGNGDVYTSNNQFNFNTYYVPSLSTTHWVWASAWINWAAWRGYGLDPNGAAYLNIGDATAPVISTVAAAQITSSTATISWTTNEPADGTVAFGLTGTYGQSTMLNTALVTTHSQLVSGLAASTLYHYRVQSRDPSGNLALSGDGTFTTASDTQAPTIPTNLQVSGPTTSALTFTWTASTDNIGVTGYRLDASTSGSFSSFVTGYNNKSVGNVTTASVTGLSPGTRYFVLVRAYDAAGNVSGNSTMAQGTTLPSDTTAPVLSSIKALSITSSQATIKWTTNESADSQVEYGPTTAYGKVTPVDSALVTAHSQLLSPLAANTLYHYRVISGDATGNRATSGDFTFTTARAK
jgi:hypothetical protein